MLTFALLGFALQLVGLGWDLLQHRADPALAAREYPLGLGSLGHLLFAAGLALSLAGLVGALAGRTTAALWPTWLGPRPRTGLALGLLALFTATGALGVWASRETGPLDGRGMVGRATAEEHSGSAGGRPDALRAELDERLATGQLTAQEAGVILQRVQGMLHPGGDGVPISAAELDGAARLLADVRRDTVRLADVQIAEAEGYQPIPVGSRAGVIHYSNGAYYGRILDTERPQQVIYRRLPDGTMELVGVLFVMPYDVPGPRVGGPLTAWHAHDDVCVDPATFRPTGATDAAGQCPPSTERRTSSEMLHVWLVDNPRGVFDSWMTLDVTR